MGALLGVSMGRRLLEIVSDSSTLAFVCMEGKGLDNNFKMNVADIILNWSEHGIVLGGGAVNSCGGLIVSSCSDGFKNGNHLALIGLMKCVRLVEWPLLGRERLILVLIFYAAMCYRSILWKFIEGVVSLSLKRSLWMDKKVPCFNCWYDQKPCGYASHSNFP